jgi:hypothetical protein
LKHTDKTSQKIMRRQKEWEGSSEGTKTKEIGPPGLSFEKKVKQ